MRSARSLAIVFTLLLSLGLQASIAGAAPAPTGGRLARLAQDVGDTVAINNGDGDEIGTVTLEDIVDPFDEFEERPEPDLRFLSIELTIENTGEESLEVATGNIGVVDDIGTIFIRVLDITRTDNAPPLEDASLEPGEDVTGALAVGFPEDGEIAQIIWFVDTGILPVIYNAADPVTPGGAVMLSTADYTDYEELAELTVDELTDPLDESELGRGLRAVGATISIENAGAEPFAPEPGSFFLGATDGAFWSPDPVVKRGDEAIDELPDLTDEEIEPDDSVTGFVGFAIPEDAEIAYLMYVTSDGARMLRLYDAETEGGDDPDDDDRTGGNLGPIGRDDEDEDETPDAGDDNGSASDDECDGATAWAEETIARFGELQQAMSGSGMGVDFASSSSSALSDAAEAVAAAAESQASSTPPPAAEELNELLVSFFEDAAEILNEAADADDGEDLDDAQQRWFQLGETFASDEVTAIADEALAACPELNDLQL